MIPQSDMALPVLGDGGSCTLLLLRTPPQLLVGLDMAQWRVGEKFRGIRSIDSGCHFLHWTESSGLQTPLDFAPAGAECTYTRMRVDEAIGSTGQRGEFLYFRDGQIIIREWSVFLGRFLPLSEEEALRYAAGVERQDFIHGLGPYPKHMRAQWKALTANISLACVNRVEPIGHYLSAQGMPLTPQEQNIIDQHQRSAEKTKRTRTTRQSIKRADAGTEDEEEEILSRPAEEEDDSKREQRECAEAASCKMFYMDIKPAKASAVRAAREALTAAKRSGSDASAAAAAAAAAVTLQCTDRTDTLLQLVEESEEGWHAILGEMQMAFIALVLGHHYPSLVHWREVVELLCTSERAVYLCPKLYVKFIDAFHAQLEQAPDEMTQGALQEGNFLSSNCASLLETCCSIDRESARHALQTSKANILADRRKATTEGDSGSTDAEVAAATAKAMEQQYKEVETAAARLCDLVRLLFRVSRGGGELGEISAVDEILFSLQGPDAPVVVDAAALGSSEAEAVHPVQE